MKKWIIAAIAFAALFWGAHVLDNKHASDLPVIQVSDPKTFDPPAPPPVPPVVAPVPVPKPDKRPANRRPPAPPKNSAPPTRSAEPLPAPRMVYPCYLILQCV